MSEETTLRDLFDRWERVWHEGQYDLIPDCIGPYYVRHDEAGDRTVTREAYAAQIAKFRQERPHTHFVAYDHTFNGDRAWFRSSGLMQRPARHAPEQACRFTGSRLASWRRLGLFSNQ
jgi:hypothetical protein